MMSQVTLQLSVCFCIVSDTQRAEQVLVNMYMNLTESENDKYSARSNVFIITALPVSYNKIIINIIPCSFPVPLIFLELSKISKLRN